MGGDSHRTEGRAEANNSQMLIRRCSIECIRQNAASGNARIPIVPTTDLEFPGS